MYWCSAVFLSVWPFSRLQHEEPEQLVVESGFTGTGKKHSELSLKCEMGLFLSSFPLVWSLGRNPAPDDVAPCVGRRSERNLSSSIAWIRCPRDERRGDRVKTRLRIQGTGSRRRGGDSGRLWSNDQWKYHKKLSAAKVSSLLPDNYHGALVLFGLESRFRTKTQCGTSDNRFFLKWDVSLYIKPEE